MYVLTNLVGSCLFYLFAADYQPSGSLTRLCKTNIFNRQSYLQPAVLHNYVRLPDGIYMYMFI